MILHVSFKDCVACIWVSLWKWPIKLYWAMC